MCLIRNYPWGLKALVYEAISWLILLNIRTIGSSSMSAFFCWCVGVCVYKRSGVAPVFFFWHSCACADDVDVYAQTTEIRKWAVWSVQGASQPPRYLKRQVNVIVHVKISYYYSVPIFFFHNYNGIQLQKIVWLNFIFTRDGCCFFCLPGPSSYSSIKSATVSPSKRALAEHRCG